LNHAFLLVLAREPSAIEAAGMQSFYATQLATYEKSPQDAESLAQVGLYRVDASIDTVELAAWTQVARVLLNLNETLVRY
jgi:hypothetical protein